jgi:redox-sensitive bicupin YhaK (pirin superfamily)
MSQKVILKKAKLSFPMFTQSPFLFGVFHKDLFPAGDEKMHAPRKGNGNDFNETAPYRMYHGEGVPGFPQHPHRGFETITCTIEGLIDHTDSLGCGGRYGQGDLQWMTAGRGIVHGEIFPLRNQHGNNPCKFFQLWINLPKESKFVEPTQRMHWGENIPHYEADGVDVTIWAGKFQNVKALPPPPDSYASSEENDVGIFFIKLSANSQIPLTPTKESTNRTIYYIDPNYVTGDNKKHEFSTLLINNESLEVNNYATLSAANETILKNSWNVEIQVLVLEGKPIDEPVVQHGPFVMNTQAEIQQTFEEYRKTRFGGWPWKVDAVVFPSEKGRFLDLKGKKTEFPPTTRK